MLGISEYEAMPASGERATLSSDALALVPAATLPLEPAEGERLGRLAQRINAIYRGATLDVACAIGQLVIQELFQGNVAIWGHEGTRRPSYRMLAARGDLLLSPSALCRAVAVYALCERLGGRENWRHLTASHLQEVLALEMAQQERLLRSADAERWTVSRLRTEVSRQRPDARRGRARALAKTVRDLKTLLFERHERLVDARAVAELDGRTADELRETVTLLRSRLEELDELLGCCHRAG